MKIRSLASALLVSCLTGAVLTASAKPVAYAVLQDGVLTFRYDENKPEGDNVWDFPTPGTGDYDKTDNAPWKDERANITSVVVEESMRNYEVVAYGLNGLFKGCENLTSLVGLGNFNMTKVARMLNMFQGCQKMNILELRCLHLRQLLLITADQMLQSHFMLDIFVQLSSVKVLNV